MLSPSSAQVKKAEDGQNMKRRVGYKTGPTSAGALLGPVLEKPSDEQTRVVKKKKKTEALRLGLFTPGFARVAPTHVEADGSTTNFAAASGEAEDGEEVFEEAREVMPVDVEMAVDK